MDNEPHKTKSACLLNILTKQNTLTKTVFTFQQGAQSIFIKDAQSFPAKQV